MSFTADVGVDQENFPAKFGASLDQEHYLLVYYAFLKQGTLQDLE